MMNFSVFFGNQSIAKDVQALGTVAVYNQAYAQLLPTLLGGCLAQIVYCIYLFKKNNSFNKYFVSGTGTYWLHGCLMAFFWFAGMVLFSIASGKYMPKTGNVVCWPLFLSSTIIVSNILGVLTREWKGVSKKAFMRMYGGIALLIIAIVLSSLSGTFAG